MRLTIIIICLLCITVNSYADKISSPPPLPTESREEQDYFDEIYRNIHRLEVVSTNPDNTREGKPGDMVLYHTTGYRYLEINIGSKEWMGVLLTDTP